MRLDAVEANYDRLAPVYDVATELVFHRMLGLGRLRDRTIDRLGDVAGAAVLDVGCGTGNNWPRLVPRVGPSGRVVGIDWSAGMLARACRRVECAGWPNVTLARDDAAVLSTVSSQVDATISVWCLGIVHDLPAALERLVEVTKPGGRVAILDFAQSRPDRGPLRALFPVYRKLLVTSGVDAPEDINDEALRVSWREGIAVLRERLPDLVEERHLDGAGLLLHGTRPIAKEAIDRCS